MQIRPLFADQPQPAGHRIVLGRLRDFLQLAVTVRNGEHEHVLLIYQFSCYTYRKYQPEQLASDGSSAAYNVVCAPERAVFRNGHTNGLIKILGRQRQCQLFESYPVPAATTTHLDRKLLKMLMCRISSVSTMPGCTAFTVTPLPSRRFASSRVKSTLASLLWL